MSSLHNYSYTEVYRTVICSNLTDHCPGYIICKHVFEFESECYIQNGVYTIIEDLWSICLVPAQVNSFMVLFYGINLSMVLAPTIIM